jgi:hypothetical protein
MEATMEEQKSEMSLPESAECKYRAFDRDRSLDWKKWQAAEQSANFAQTDSTVSCYYSGTPAKRRQVKTKPTRLKILAISF